ncbi:MAG: DEAD/DEAH box helicase family protein, partial [Planctomycetales bacterium]|nr:DEAD/DEAH box helicase family protein [Planctomycetales bacterium]
MLDSPSPSTRFAAPAVESLVDCGLRAQTYPTGWGTALARLPKVRVESWSPGRMVVATRDALPRKPRGVQVFSVAFAESGWLAAAKSPAETNARSAPRRDTANGAPAADSAAAPATRTRIRPPRDAVKLEDRLYYLLQPPLESLFSSGALAFPFRPFPYQLAGIAFLYSRHAAVLADEMGLGKTMQAITTIRLLLHAREVRRVLLVCPKPLVTNWQREFRLWAPEIPVTIVEGDAARRAWQWSLPDAPVRIANYELLMRDRDLIDRDDAHFDLVVLDEAQRI